MTTKVELHLITKEDFQAYENVRKSGGTNMWAISTVKDWSGLEEDIILAIMSNYSKLCEMYPDVRTLSH